MTNINTNNTVPWTKTWRTESEKLQSKGSTYIGPKGLPGLHQKREVTDSQHFTPTAIAHKIAQSIQHCFPGDRDNAILDCSVGNGRLLDPFHSHHFSLYATDIDDRCIDALTLDAEAADIDHTFKVADLSEITASGFQLSLLNPPFSRTLLSPNLQPYPCTHWGKYGPNSAAISQHYALELSLDAAEIVVAILPASMTDFCRETGRLAAIYKLPNSAFLEENANVSTAVFYFGSKTLEDPICRSVTPDSQWPPVQLHECRRRTSPRLTVSQIDPTTPTITLPITGDKTVELHHHNHTIVLKYFCAFTMAKVHNAVLRRVAHGERLPTSITYEGDTRLNLDVMLLQHNPEAQLDLLASFIKDHDGIPRITPNLQNFYRKLINRHKIASTPMHRTVLQPASTDVVLTSLKRQLLIPGDFTSPSIAAGTHLFATINDGVYTVGYKAQFAKFTRDDLLKRFSIDSDHDQEEAKWVVKHPGLNKLFPHLDQQHRARVINHNIDWLAKFQLDAVVEALISPVGFLGALDPGSGKTRIIIALALLHSGRSMVIVEAGLLPEFLNEFAILGISKHSYSVLDVESPANTKITLTTYHALRSKKGKLHSKKLRRRYRTVFCDEGSCLSNTNTKQARSVDNLAAHKLVIYDGTIIRNYPRNVLPLAVKSAGNSCAHQPYGTKGRAFIEPRLIHSANDTQRGEDTFKDDYITLVWVTHQWEEDHITGGKREIPRIADVDKYRRWIEPNLQRRVRSEPALAEFANCPAPTHTVKTIPFDTKHLAVYLKVALEFREWFVKARQADRKSINLIAVLARIAAVQHIANNPHTESSSENFQNYYPLTSKQRYCIDLIDKLVAKGKKIIVYAKSPSLLERLRDNINCDSVLFTGEINIPSRTKELNDRFKNGDTPVLLSSQVGSRGLNIAEADTIIYYERQWSSSAEEQALYRTQRPSQKAKVACYYLHLDGSIDTYMAQMVMWKKAAAAAGIDYQTQETDDEEFMHLDTILSQFCEKAYALSLHQMKGVLSA